MMYECIDRVSFHGHVMMCAYKNFRHVDSHPRRHGSMVSGPWITLITYKLYAFDAK